MTNASTMVSSIVVPLAALVTSNQAWTISSTAAMRADPCRIQDRAER
jgi:hypothetical protein